MSIVLEHLIEFLNLNLLHFTSLLVAHLDLCVFEQTLSLLSSRDAYNFVVVHKELQELFLYVIQLDDVQSLVKIYNSVVLLSEVHNVTFASCDLKHASLELFI